MFSESSKSSVCCGQEGPTSHNAFEIVLLFVVLCVVVHVHSLNSDRRRGVHISFVKSEVNELALAHLLCRM